MFDNAVPSKFNGSIHPFLFTIGEGFPDPICLIGTLGRLEWEHVAIKFIFVSRQLAKWSGLEYDDRVKQDSTWAEMVREGLLIETTSEGGWTYELSTLAIEKIYVHQSQATINALKNKLERQLNMSLWRRLTTRMNRAFA